MRVYRTDRDGIEVLRLSGTVDDGDAGMLASHLGSRNSAGGCCILDFSGVDHVDYRVFRIFEDLSTMNPGVIFSGLDDYLLNIFAFASGKRMTPVFANWRKALGYLMAERGRMGVQAAAAGG